ncbi:MAG TPA: PTS fructose transporter subunit IIA [Planctomycetaceae bacterium]|nr:PTS fructose transporter subunit IIA [Planctomycetaceae bacterium]
MSETNFDLSELAKYLHLPEAQVKKMADRGHLPGRKVKGEWMFSGSEIHLWLENRIGMIESDRELATVEGALTQSVPADEIVPISDLIPPGGIELPLGAKTKESVIRGMTGIGVRTGLLWDPEKMAEALRKREELHPTALDNGVALLHPRRPMAGILGETFIALGLNGRGIPFGGGFDSLTDIFFLICSMDDRVHLRVLARLSRILTVKGFLEQLREQETEKEVRALIAATEKEIV